MVSCFKKEKMNSMFDSDALISKPIKTEQGEDKFQIRFISSDKIGILTTQSEQSYFILDSEYYWYDTIQEKYPMKRKCKCGHDYFKVEFEYTPRVGTDDYRKIDIVTCCAKCGINHKISSIDIDYSPTKQLFDQPITFCKEPKIKYKVFKICKGLDDVAHETLLEFISGLGVYIYVWYRDFGGKRYISQLDPNELIDFIYGAAKEHKKHLAIFFSMTSMDSIIDSSITDDEGVYIDQDVWRKNEIIEVCAPIIFAGKEPAYLYNIYFCNEYIERGSVKSKSAEFRSITDSVNDYLNTV